MSSVKGYIVQSVETLFGYEKVPAECCGVQAGCRIQIGAKGEAKQAGPDDRYSCLREHKAAICHGLPCGCVQQTCSFPFFQLGSQTSHCAFGASTQPGEGCIKEPENLLRGRFRREHGRLDCVTAGCCEHGRHTIATQHIDNEESTFVQTVSVLRYMTLRTNLPHRRCARARAAPEAFGAIQDEQAIGSSRSLFDA